MRRYRIAQIDAFTGEIFGGNPAGVVPKADGLTDRQMQLVAREMNLSETAFVTEDSGKNCFRVRFFTPTHEVDLCGHATVAAFWLLAWENRLEVADGCASARQRTRAGPLPVQVRFTGGRPEEVMMDQAAPRRLGAVGWDCELLDILGLPRCPTSALPEPEVISTGLAGLMVPVRDRELLWSLAPDYSALAAYCRKREIVSVHCFTRDVLDKGCFVHCRDFSPAVGVPEDPATGTASGALTAYLAYHDLLPAASDGAAEAAPVRICMEQGHSTGRPGIIRTEVRVRDGRPVQVRVGGAARLVLDGTIRIR